jgi:drug/metabolite transporter (DMT)-like permease
MLRPVIAELLAAFLWALGSIFVAYFALIFDVPTQNFFRYMSASLFLLAFSLIFNKRKYLASIRQLKAILPPTIIVFVFQFLNIYGIELTTPTIGTLVTRLSVIFVDLFSFIFFYEERAIVRNKYFLWGTLVAFLGTMGVIMTGSSLFYTNDLFFLGVLLSLLSAVLWALYIVTTKVSLGTVDPLSVTTNVFLISGAMFLPFSFLSNGFFRIFQVDTTTIVILLISGIVSVGIGNLLNNFVIREIGTSVSTSLQLLSIVFTAILSVVVFNEPMPLLKVVFSIVTLAGCWLILKASNSKDRKT